MIFKKVNDYWPTLNLGLSHVGFMEHRFYGVTPLPKTIQLPSLNSDQLF